MQISEQAKKIKLDYHFVSVEPEEIERRLQQAYGVLFESVLKDYQLNKKNETKINNTL